ncbi:hypothetical protein O3M35_011622 [Rhynocoris fuscipes]|uniref:Phenoloxidase-activating factor 2 n=1 Tax=Rhynocoris fuscipes TaxID=488301 RepID=A0AAW1CYU3_9HEMI
MMLRSFKISTLLVLALVCYTLAAEKDWSWNKKEGENSAASESATDSSQEREADVEPAGVNETHARHFVKDRLCDLGLGGCGEDEEIEGKRPHVQPHDLIYAQPVHLKPVGRPIPAIPVRGTGGITPPPISSNIYGPPRPVSLPYRPNNRPYKPYVSGPPPSVYEPDHDHSILQEKRPIGVVSGPSAAGSSSVQTHVHHHYHHGDDNKYPEIQTGISGSGGLYEPGNSLSSGIYSPGSSYNTYPFYKKQLSVKQPHALGGISGNLGPHQPYEKYPPFEPVRNGINDCYCVPYDQCPPNEIARKEDIRGPGLIDPRNNPNTDIQALGPDEVVVTDGNGTMTIVKQKRELNDDEASNLDTANKDRQRRDVGVDAAAEASDKSINAKKLAGLGGGGGGGLSDEDGDGLKLRPTFGVSFGLPSGANGYPLNPWGQYPALNPYGSSIGGPGGVNLGLVSVNPLLSLQVTKDEYGDKVVKPLVNLHVTPNHGLVNKIGSIFHHLKEPYYPQPPYLNHHHLHVHKIPPPVHYHPIKPSYPYAPHYSYPQSSTYYRPSPNYIRPYYQQSSPYIRDTDDYDDEDDDYYRSSSSSGATNSDPSRTTQSSDKPNKITFPEDRVARNKRNVEERQAYYGGSGRCGPSQVCCRRPARTGSQYRPPGGQYTAQCGVRNAHGINGRIKTPVYVDGDSEFGEYPWQVAVLKKDPQESVYICGGTLIDASHVLTAAHCIKSYTAYDLRVRLGEWDVNHDVEFFPYEERDVSVVHVHPEFYAGTLYNDLAILRLDRPASVGASPHISPACLPEAHADFSGSRCWTTGWGKDAFGDYGKYQNILKEVDVPVLPHHQCQSQLQQTRLGYDFKLHPGFICAGGEEGKDACKGDGGGPMVCERNGVWQIVGVVSWGVGCGQYGVPGVYVRVQHYLPWIRQIVGQFK